MPKMTGDEFQRRYHAFEAGTKDAVFAEWRRVRGQVIDGVVVPVKIGTGIKGYCLMLLVPALGIAQLGIPIEIYRPDGTDMLADPSPTG